MLHIKNKTLRVVCAIIEREGLVLITQRSSTMSQPLLWEFPGGKIEAGESETEGLEREILEELNVCVTANQRLTPVLHAYPDFSIELIPYSCRFDSGTVCLLEHRASEWVPVQELTSYTWCPADLPIVEEYMRLYR